MSKLRLGLIGYGSWAQDAYIPALQNDGRAVIRSVAAPSRATRRLISDQLGSEVIVFDGFESLLNGPELDAVMIAIPDSMHEQALSAALDSGVAVFYEPPITDTRHRILPMLGRLLAATQVTFADLELNFIPAVGRAAGLVQAGTLGNIQAARIRLQAGWGPVPNYDLCNFNHLSTWYVDVLNNILGSTPERVLVLDGQGTPGRRQNHSIGHLDYEGILGTVQANIASVGELEITVEVNGDDGDVVLNLLTGETRLRFRDNPNWIVEQWPAMLPYADWPGLHESVAVSFPESWNNRYQRIIQRKKFYEKRKSFIVNRTKTIKTYLFEKKIY